jgi:uncharacterized protein YqhQ
MLMAASGNYTENFSELLQEVKRYVSLQKSFIMLDTADKLTVILSTVAIAVVCFVIGAMVLFFLTFALAYWIGQIANNMAFGFLCIAAIQLILLLIAWRKRNDWIIQPLARMMARIFYNQEQEQEE